MVYVCPELDHAVQKPCERCVCGMDMLPEFLDHPQRFSPEANARYRQMSDEIAEKAERWGVSRRAVFEGYRPPRNKSY